MRSAARDAVSSEEGCCAARMAPNAIAMTAAQVLGRV
jgi:hypothetical protein